MPRLARRLLRAHVHRGAEREAGLGQPGADRGIERPGNAEVGDDGVPVREQDVLRLDVPMDHALRVGTAQRLGHLAGDPHGLVHRQLPFPVQPTAQRFARDERHGVPQALGRPIVGRRLGPAVEHRQDEWVLQPGGDLDLPEEPLGAEHVGQLGPEDLDGDRSGRV